MKNDIIAAQGGVYNHKYGVCAFIDVHRNKRIHTSENLCFAINN